MTRDEHKQRHVELHQSFDQLLADFIYHTGKLPSRTTLAELIEWSFQQTQNPTSDGLAEDKS